MVKNNIWQEWRWSEGYLFSIRACQDSGVYVIMLIHQTSAKQNHNKTKGTAERSDSTE